MPSMLRLETLPNELIALIFIQMGDPPKGKLYEIQNLDDIHPCYAVCSLSSFYASLYIRTMGPFSIDIAITLHPTDYISPDKSVEARLLERLHVFALRSPTRVVSCHLIGPKLNRDTGIPRVNKWLTVVTAYGKLEPEHRVFVKQHVERDLAAKKAIISSVFDVFCKSFKHIKDLKITPDETPVTVWDLLVRQYIFKSQDTLMTCQFIQAQPRDYRKLYYFLGRLARRDYFPTREEQPAGYPVSAMHNRDAFERLNVSMKAYLTSYKALRNFRLNIG